MIELYAFLTSLGFWQWFAVLLVVKWTLQFPSSIIKAFTAHKILWCCWPKDEDDEPLTEGRDCDSEDIELSRKGECSDPKTNLN